jgi:hypothetical protein
LIAGIQYPRYSINIAQKQPIGGSTVSKQDNSFSRPEMLGMTAGFRLRKRALAGVAAILMGASLVFSPSTSAHNIDLAKAREMARNYARMVRDQSGGGVYGKFVHYSTNCVRAFPGHNHIARCLIEYQNEADTKKGVYTCRELIEIKMPPHNGDQVNYELYGFHASNNQCGRNRLNNTPMY